jgi:hypothetical protein
LAHTQFAGATCGAIRLKLLAQARQVLNPMVSEGLCDEPQKKVMQAMLGLGAAFAAGMAAPGPQLTEPEARTIPNGMRQTVRLRLAALASSAEEA